jgi:Spy/CpxP family protein refolding chaperone
MKKFLLMCCFLMGIAAVSHAQGGGMRKSPEDRAKDLQTQLKLTDDQAAKITAIYKEQAVKMDSVRTAANGDRDAMRSAMMPMRKATNDKVKAILTPDQATAFDKMQKDMMDRMRQGGGGGGGSQN